MEKVNDNSKSFNSVKQSNEAKPVSRAGIYILYLFLITSLVLSFTLSRYSSQTTGTGTATIALVAGEIDQTIDIALTGMYPGCPPKSIPFAITNFSDNGEKSEVRQLYTVTLTTTGNLPLTFSLSNGQIIQGGGTLIQEGEFPPNISSDSARNPASSGIGTLPLLDIGSKHRYEIDVLWLQSEDSHLYCDEIDMLTITVEAKQAQT